MAEHSHTPFEEVTCREFVELVTDYWDGALPESRLELVEEHLVMCDWCKTYMDQLELTVSALPSVGDESVEVPQGTHAALAEALRARKAGE